MIHRFQTLLSNSTCATTAGVEAAEDARRRKAHDTVLGLKVRSLSVTKPGTLAIAQAMPDPLVGPDLVPCRWIRYLR